METWDLFEKVWMDESGKEVVKSAKGADEVVKMKVPNVKKTWLEDLKTQLSQ